MKTLFARFALISYFVAGIFLTAWSTLAVAAPVTVKVGLSPFPPYAETVRDKKTAGIAVELMQIMNAFQAKYRFVGVPTSSMRRIEFFEDGEYDMSMFDHLHWGWQKLPVDATRVYLRGGEKYVALAKPGRSQAYFDDFRGKKLAGFLGYHYQLANFNNDPNVLRDGYNMEVSSNHEGNLLKVILERVDIAVVTDAFLSRWLILHPKYDGKLLVSDKWDQKYNFVMLIRKGVSPTVEELNALLTQMEEKGVLLPLWKKYGISQ